MNKNVNLYYFKDIVMKRHICSYGAIKNIMRNEAFAPMEQMLNFPYCFLQNLFLPSTECTPRCIYEVLGHQIFKCQMQKVFAVQ